MKMIRFYGTSAWHLCEDAEKLLVRNLAGKEYTKLDIADSEKLFQKYGESIPVVKRGDGRELSWPFDHESLKSFLSVD